MHAPATPWAKRPRHRRSDARLADEAAVGALTPDRPVLRPALFDPQVHDRQWIDTVDAPRLGAFRRRGTARLATRGEHRLAAADDLALAERSGVVPQLLDFITLELGNALRRPFIRALAELRRGDIQHDAATKALARGNRRLGMYFTPREGTARPSLPLI